MTEQYYTNIDGFNYQESNTGTIPGIKWVDSATNHEYRYIITGIEFAELIRSKGTFTYEKSIKPFGTSEWIVMKTQKAEINNNNWVDASGNLIIDAYEQVPSNDDLNVICYKYENISGSSRQFDFVVSNIFKNENNIDSFYKYMLNTIKIIENNGN